MDAWKLPPLSVHRGLSLAPGPEASSRTASVSWPAKPSAGRMAMSTAPPFSACTVAAGEDPMVTCMVSVIMD